jgi:hypothetical protein
MNPSILWNPAGGLRYHLRAQLYSKQLWEPFRWAIGEYLLEWKPTAKVLLLVGPSGGYCLQPFFFERFERVICLEPDPVAQWVFRRRLAMTPLESRPTLEFIAEDHLVSHPERLPTLAASLGDCAILFSNVLGQVRGLLGLRDAESESLERVRAAVREATAGRAFASFHDRVSGRLRPTFVQPFSSDRRLTDDELVEELYKYSREWEKNRELSLFDHLTDGFFPAELPHTYFTWPLLPGHYHIIEAVSVTR